MIFKSEKETKDNEFINLEIIKDYFNSSYINEKYINPEKAAKEKKEHYQDIKNKAGAVKDEINKKIEHKLETFPNNLKNTKGADWNWILGSKIKDYFWLCLKKKDYEKYISSISLFIDKNGIRVVIEADYEDNERRRIQDYSKHNEYLKKLQSNIKDLGNIKFWPKKDTYNEDKYESIDILSKYNTEHLKDIYTLQAGYLKTYDDLEKEFNNLNKVHLKDIISWIHECIDILLPYYEKCIEGEKEDMAKLEEATTTDENTATEKWKNINFDEDFKIKNLYYEDKDLLEKQISTALKNGKHIILTGPPGTGKSKLAKEICEHYKANYKMTTALADWSTYDTIGGYVPSKDGSLDFQPGIFLSCFKDKNLNDNKKNEWLIIDEMNRADIDKAFGVFFSALTGDSVDLSFVDKNGKNIKILNEKDKEKIKEVDEYIIPTDFRLIGTINSSDKTSLFEMSYAFMRRFAFIPVSVSKKIDKSKVQNYLKTWEIKNEEDWYLDGLSKIWGIINKYRKFGPAIAKDIALFVKSNEDWASAIVLYVLPQFEGLDKEKFGEFYKEIKDIDFIENKSIIINFIEDFFGIELTNEQ